MSHFEFVFTGLSFLVALMLGRILNTLAQLDFKSTDYRHIGWLVLLIIHSMLFWWLSWRFHKLDFSVHMYFVLLSAALVLFFAISVLTPERAPEEWAGFFESKRKRFFASYIVFWVVSGAGQYVLSSEFRPPIVPLLLSVLGALFGNRFVQWGILLLMGATFILLALVFPENVK